MHIRFARTRPFVRVCAVICLAIGLVWSASLSTALATAGEGGETQVRTIPSDGPTLSEMEKGPGWSYNSDYIFAVSRAVRDSTVPPAGKVPLFILTIPLDTVFLPFSLLAGLLGN